MSSPEGASPTPHLQRAGLLAWRPQGAWDYIAIAYCILTLAIPFLRGHLLITHSGGVFDVGARLYDVNVIILLYMVLALGLNIVVGWVGLLELGYVGFVLIGVYTSAILSGALAPESTVISPETGVFSGLREGGGEPHAGPGDLVSMSSIAGSITCADGRVVEVTFPDRGRFLEYIVAEGTRVTAGETLIRFKELRSYPFFFLIVMAVASLHALFWGLIRGIPILRLRDDYFAIVTFAFAEIVYTFVKNEVWLTRGPKGFPSESSPSLGLFELRQNSAALYLFVAFSVVVLTIAMARLSRSRIGRAWFAIRADETSAKSSGIRVNRFRLLAFGISAMVAGFGGSLMSFQYHVISTNTFDFWMSVIALSCLVLGGMGSIRGALIGAAILMGTGELLRDVLPWLNVDARARILFYGIVMIGIMIFRAKGVHPPGLHREPFVASDLSGIASDPGSLYRLGAERVASTTESARPLLSVRGLTKRFGGCVAVSNVDMDVMAGSITALIGPNGAGKTTLFNMVTSLYVPTDGEVRYFGAKSPHGFVSSGSSADVVAAQGIARTFQNIRLFGELSALDNVRVGFHLRSHRGGQDEGGLWRATASLGAETAAALLSTRAARREEDEVTRAALGYLKFVGLLDRAEQQADSLPYGQQRRVEIARALALGPELLLLDEPAAGMNPQETEDLCGLIESIRAAGVTVFLIEHDMSLVMRVSEAITVIDHGEVIASGTPDEIRNDPAVIEAYLGTEDLGLLMLTLDDIQVWYGGIHALKGVSLQVEAGQIITLIGANGAGKSTALKTISGLLRPKSGDIRLDGKSLTRVRPDLIVGRGLVHCPEGRRIFRSLSVEENLGLGAYLRRDKAAIAEDKKFVIELFPRLEERRTQLGGTLSGGEQQMLAIGRALMSRPRLLMLDEPSLGIAPILVQEIFRAILKLNRERGMTILLVEQNARAALRLASRAYVIETGKITIEGPAAELAEDPRIREAYLGA